MSRTDDTASASASSSENACDVARELVEDLVAGSLTDAETARMLAHLRRCEPCTELFELHAKLSDWEAPDAEPTADDFAALRATVLSQLESAGRVHPAARRFGLFRVAEPPSAQWRLALAALFSVAMLGLGWWVGRSSQLQPTGGEAFRLSHLQLALASGDFGHYDLQDVRLREVDASTVALSFDLATHLEVERPKGDPLVTEALVQSILGGSDLGGRLSSISQTSETLSPRVRDALAQAMLEDPSLAVRIEAQQRLARATSDPAIQDACLQVLEREESVQMRLVAIDILTSGGVASDRLRQAVETGRPEPGNALKVRAAQYLNEQYLNEL